jgi:isocitrate dehydrogenase
MQWGYLLARKNTGRSPSAPGLAHLQEPDQRHDIVIKDVIADNFLQQVLLRARGLRRHCDAEPQR